MPPYSSSAFPPAYLFADDIKGSRSLCSSVCVCMLILQKRENGHKPRTVKEVLPKQNFAYRPCFCLSAACQNPLCLLSPARSPSGTLCCLISQPKQHFYFFSGECFTFSGIYSTVESLQLVRPHCLLIHKCFNLPGDGLVALNVFECLMFH